MATTLTVTGTSWTSPDVRRIHFWSSDLSAFSDSQYTDRYVKLVFPKDGVSYPEGVDLRELRHHVPADDLPDVRTYTALHPDTAAGTLAIDFVVHGDEGVAGPWAASAQLGDEIVANGPGGAYRPDPDADWYLLVGDESALPAVLAAMDDLPADAAGHAVILVEDEGREAVVPERPGVEVTWVYRRGRDDDDLLVDAVSALDWPSGAVDAFVHGEAQEVMHGLRPLLLKQRAVPRERLSISGYWRRGRTEPAFREWKSELARAEGDVRDDRKGRRA